MPSTKTLDAILADLAENDGAILYFQINDSDASEWAKAVARNDIKFDEETDCYVHPAAVRNTEDGETMFYTMPVSA